jgi:tetratricopeptide (TPR) repeat protein
MRARTPKGTRRTCFVRTGAVLLLSLLSACRPSPVLRVSRGRAFQERSIAAEAYAAYVRGRLFEQKNDSVHAAEQYRLVLSRDPDSLEAMVRLAAISCSRSPAESATWWVKAEHLDAESPMLWLERARCELSNGHLELASEDAERTLHFDPESEDAISILVTASSALNRPDAGLVWLRAALAAEPSNAHLWKLSFEHEKVTRAERLYAASQLYRLRHPDQDTIPERFRSGVVSRGTVNSANAVILEGELTQALDQDNVESARELATRLGINPEQLALMALRQGAHSVASAQAALLLAIEPENSAMWVVGILAADEQRESTHYSTLLAHPPTRPLPTDSALRGRLLDLLRRRTAFDVPHEQTASRPE